MHLEILSINEQKNPRYTVAIRQYDMYLMVAVPPEKAEPPTELTLLCDAT